MIAIETKLEEIAAVCEENGVKRLELFGSYARGEGSSDSDVDFVVEFADPLRAGVFDRYLALHSSLQAIFGCHVDLLERSAIENPILVARIAADRKLVYAA